MMNPHLEQLHPYPFERLNSLLSGVDAPDSISPILFSLGEPKHSAPDFIIDQLTDKNKMAQSLGTYPVTRGLPELRIAIASWIERRYNLPESAINPDQQVLPVGGTREALFSIAQAVVSSTSQSEKPVVLMPNPFYQIYEGASLLSGAEPVYMPCDAETNYLPDFDTIPESIWKRCQLVYICTPGNPTGAVLSETAITELIRKAEQFDFIIASDECYSEIYYDDDCPPPGLLSVCLSAGNTDFKRCVAFNSLSKRSNLPGLRSGFVAGDAELIEKYFLYRTYHGAALPLHTQLASILAWGDEQHVIANRALYQEKMNLTYPLVSQSLKVGKPEAGFYLWPEVPGSDEQFTRDLFATQNVKVLPGSYLARSVNGHNPGSNRVRMALVATRDDCVIAASRIADFVSDLTNRQ